MKSNGTWCIRNGKEIMVNTSMTLTFILIYLKVRFCLFHDFKTKLNILFIAPLF